MTNVNLTKNQSLVVLNGAIKTFCLDCGADVAFGGDALSGFVMLHAGQPCSTFENADVAYLRRLINRCLIGDVSSVLRERAVGVRVA